MDQLSSASMLIPRRQPGETAASSCTTANFTRTMFLAVRLRRFGASNPAADFVGLYDDTNGNEHGFLQRSGGLPRLRFDSEWPAVQRYLTDAFAINPAG